MDGKKVAAEIRQKLKQEISQEDLHPALTVLLVGENPASQIYVRLKEKACNEVGIRSIIHRLSSDISEEELITMISGLNDDHDVHGILVQLPLPASISTSRVIMSVSPEKDVDGFHPLNKGKMLMGEPTFVPCTPLGVMRLLEYYGIPIKGQDAVVLGRSLIVGSPVSQLLLERSATVTTCHSKTKDIASYTKKADIIVSAVGKKNLVTKDMVKEGAVVIDVAIIKDDGGICGDVDFGNVMEKCSYISPVPGGVGPMTIACLLDNTLHAYRRLTNGP